MECSVNTKEILLVDNGDGFECFYTLQGIGGFPGGSVVKNMPASAGGIDRFSVSIGKVP